MFTYQIAAIGRRYPSGALEEPVLWVNDNVAAATAGRMDRLATLDPVQLTVLSWRLQLLVLHNV